MRITISGLPGSGTTSLARQLSEHYGIPLISSGEIFRQMAQERGLSLAAFGTLARSDPGIDRLIDEKQKEVGARNDNIILEGRLSGWMVPDADLKIWLMAPVMCRVQRIFGRDALDSEETARVVTEERERCEAERYRNFYQIEITDLSPYHIVLNSERWNVSQLGEIVGAAVTQLGQQNP